MTTWLRKRNKTVHTPPERPAPAQRSVQISRDLRKRPFSKCVQVRSIWEAKNAFCFFGNFIKGPKGDRKAVICYWATFSLVELLYFAILSPYLIMNVSYMMFCFNLTMSISTVLFSLISSWKDPGIIPRYAILRAINNGIVPERFSKLSLDEQDPASKEKKKFCQTCKIWRPERSSHCARCDCCIEVFDHHCPYLNNCIGQRNYKYFVAFLVSITLNGFGIIASLIVYITDDFSSDTNLAKTGPVQNTTMSRLIVFLVGIVAILLFVLVIILCAFHFCLIIKGKTTKEQLTKKAGKKRKCLHWLIVPPGNFKGGRHWLNKIQYEMFLNYSKDVAEGRVKENSDSRVLELFMQQREEMHENEIGSMNRQEQYTQFCDQNNYIRIKDSDESNKIEKGLLNSLSMRVKMARNQLVDSPEEITPKNTRFTEVNMGASPITYFRNSKDLQVKEFNLQENAKDESSDEDRQSFRVVVKASGKKVLNPSIDSKSFSLSGEYQASKNSSSRRVTYGRVKPKSLQFQSMQYPIGNFDAHEFDARMNTLRKSEPIMERFSNLVSSCSS